jgi:predicted transcriptional regulator YdeE
MKLFIIDSIRTNNFHDEQMMEQIKTMQENAFRKLEHHLNNVYGVYYESDYRGDYSLSIAIEENNGEAFN